MIIRETEALLGQKYLLTNGTGSKLTENKVSWAKVAPVRKYDDRTYGAERTVKSGACLSFSPTVILRRNFRQ